MAPEAFAVRVEFYREEEGAKPVAAFLREINLSNPRLATRVKEELRQLQDRRYHGLPHTKAIVDQPGLFELRVRGHDDVRVLYFFGAEREVVVVHAFVKKSQRIPTAELEVAMARKRRYERRHPGRAK
jgi:phage-related protein